eukprot:8506488-Pyramimonas_sp.AAC.1
MHIWGAPRRVIVGMSQTCLPFSRPTCFAFGADLGDVSGDSLVSALRGAAGGYYTRPLSRDCVGMPQAVWPFSLPTCFAFGADLEDVSGDSL